MVHIHPWLLRDLIKQFKAHTRTLSNFSCPAKLFDLITQARRSHQWCMLTDLLTLISVSHRCEPSSLVKQFHNSAVHFVSQSLAHELFYGAKVIDGEGRMLVASVGMNTRFGYPCPEKTPLPAQIYKVNKGTQIFGLSISILILVVLFLRFMLLKEDIKSSLPDLKEKPKAVKEIMDAIEKIVMKPNGRLVP
ncbi:hypothetical protein CFP56_010790 [Quercus suber]|uniref:Uncharacterized protein n=1 Tax=Quercus suber TaxID=58331 RepID=A0AAW0KZC9_QUESU